MYQPLGYVACFGVPALTIRSLNNLSPSVWRFVSFSTNAEFERAAKNGEFFKAILFESHYTNDYGIALKKQLKKCGFGHLPFCIIASGIYPALAKTLSAEGIVEVFKKPLSVQTVCKQLSMITNVDTATHLSNIVHYKIPWQKRVFDIVLASVALLLLLPLFIIVALCIRLESRGPVFYYSLRVGTGYKVFHFYKFRSMSANADTKLASLQHLNQYGLHATTSVPATRQCSACKTSGATCSKMLYADNEVWCETIYQLQREAKAGQAFLKIKDDPRITRIGRWLRNTSIDELPQLWNVIKGDMSLVGNRPLPLYEAEKLTTDKYALRFMAPAGITGLWQVSKRGKGSMSEEERISLDNDYAKLQGWLFDLKLLLKTLPALLQQETV